MVTPLVAVVAWPCEAAGAWAYAVPAAVLLVCGGLARSALLGASDRAPNLTEAGISVVLGWLGVCAASAVPFAVSGLTLPQALFEAVSGWTTTGLSVVDVEHASHTLLLWRSVMQLGGGAGLAILMLAAITGPPGPGVSMAEGRDQLVPHVRRSAALVVLIYSGYVVVGVPAYLLAGMTPFDAINHTFAAVSTGGFSTRSASIGAWHSPAIEAVSIGLMVLGNLNFLTAWLLVRGRFREVARDGEVRLLAILAVIGSSSVWLLTCRGLYPALGKSVRVAVFETVSALTTTGFSTVGYGDWNGFGVMVLILLMVVGGGACSTAGGLKQARVVVLLRSVTSEVRRLLAPRGAVLSERTRIGGREVELDGTMIGRAGSFATFYLVVLVVGTGVLASTGIPLEDSLFEFASALGTVGLSVGVTSTASPPITLITETIGMFLGRLEFFVVVVAVATVAGDLRRMLSSG